MRDVRFKVNQAEGCWRWKDVLTDMQHRLHGRSQSEP